MDNSKSASRRSIIEHRRSGAPLLEEKGRGVVTLCAKTAAAGACGMMLSLGGAQLAHANGEYGKAAVVGVIASVGVGFVHSMFRGEPMTKEQVAQNAATGAAAGVVGRAMDGDSWDGALAAGLAAGIGTEIYRERTQPRAQGVYPPSAGQNRAYRHGTNEHGVPILHVPARSGSAQRNFTQRTGGVSFGAAAKTGYAPGAGPEGSWNSRAVQEHNRAQLAGYRGSVDTLSVMREGVPVVVARTEIGNFTVAHRSMQQAMAYERALMQQAAGSQEQRI